MERGVVATVLLLLFLRFVSLSHKRLGSPGNTKVQQYQRRSGKIPGIL